MNRKGTRGGRTTRPPLLSMKQHIIQMGWIILLLAVVILPMGLVPWVVVRSGSGWIYDRPSEPKLAVTIHFIHSVQKTPIWEYLVVDDRQQGFTLTSTKYQSFGVGLPFLEGDGVFRKEGNFFIMDHMDRHFKTLPLRTGVGTKLSVTIGERELDVYEWLPVGSEVDITVGPLYAALLT